jgi:hypothetical protein
MRKADYTVLAAAFEKHRATVPTCARDFTESLAVLAHSEAIARTFARFAHVDKAEFLKACGIKSN